MEEAPLPGSTTQHLGSDAGGTQEERRRLLIHRPFTKCSPVDEEESSVELWGTVARKVGAEFVATFLLMFASVASAIVNARAAGDGALLGAAAAPGLALMALILTTGHISGAHLNPAVTLAFATLDRFPISQVPFYVVAQVLGSLTASYLLKAVFPLDFQAGLTIPAETEWQAFVLEFFITFNLMFVATAVATDTAAVGQLPALALGSTVAVNCVVAGPMSGAAMNPVRALGPAVAANNYTSIWLYFAAPVLGALAGAAGYRLIRLHTSAL